MNREGKPVAKLRLDSGGRRETLFLRDGEVLRVGRQEGNEVVLAEGRASRYHAIFSVQNGELVLSDLGSLNGTMVNGRRISASTILANGDVVVIADARFIVELLNEEPRAAAEATETQSSGLKVARTTLLVADICSYTRMSESLPAEEVARNLRAWCDAVAQAVAEESGQVQAYAGDAVLAIWADPAQSASTLAGCAFEAGKRILEVTAANNERWAYRERFPWRCKVSLNSGEALLGVLGPSGARDYTVLGDAVNVVFRLNDASSELGALFTVTSSTAALLEGRAELRPLGPVAVPGREEAIDVYSVRLS